MKTRGSLIIRMVGLVVLAISAGVLLGIPLQEKREERRVRGLLLQIQEAMQNYHVDEELYPKQMMSGKELVAFLKEKGFLEGPVLNPWTGLSYERSGEQDWLRYRTDSLAETYELIVYEPGTEEIQFRLDSTENQSLE